MLWLQSGTSLCPAATGDLSDTVRWQNTAPCSWNRSRAHSVQEAASRGCNILPASVTLEPGSSIPGERAADVLPSPILQSRGRMDPDHLHSKAGISMSHQLSQHQELLLMEGNTQHRGGRPRQFPEEGRVFHPMLYRHMYISAAFVMPEEQPI